MNRLTTALLIVTLFLVAALAAWVWSRRRHTRNSRGSTGHGPSATERSATVESQPTAVTEVAVTTVALRNEKREPLSDANILKAAADSASASFEPEPRVTEAKSVPSQAADVHRTEMEPPSFLQHEPLATETKTPTPFSETSRRRRRRRCLSRRRCYRERGWRKVCLRDGLSGWSMPPLRLGRSLALPSGRALCAGAMGTPPSGRLGRSLALPLLRGGVRLSARMNARPPP